MTTHSLIVEIAGSASPALPPTASLAEIDGWDSLMTVRLVLRLEEIIGQKLSEQEIDTLKTIGDIDIILRSRGVGAEHE